VTDADYRAALAAAAKEYEELGQRRREIDDRLAQLSQTIGTLNRLLGYQPTVPLGLTDAIRIVMRSGIPMTPVEVRDRLHAMGFDVSKYANDLAAVHTILKRLNEAGELRFLRRDRGRHQYTLNRSVVPVVLTKDIVQAMHENSPSARRWR
jgi:bifunctional DNA-binding transcriptional regulator/antitoxin component of YhaV-PrlF toxin-antitoxin module